MPTLRAIYQGNNISNIIKDVNEGVNLFNSPKPKDQQPITKKQEEPKP